MDANLRSAVLAGSAAVIAAGGAAVVRHHLVVKRLKPTPRTKSVDLAASVYFVSMVLWPATFAVITRAMGVSLHKQPTLAFALVWPSLLFAAQLWNMCPHRKLSVQDEHSNHAATRNAAGLMFSAAFGVGLLLAAIKGGQDVLGARVILLSLLVAVAFLAPTHSFVIGSHPQRVVLAVQTSAFYVALGMLMVGISMSYHAPGKPRA